ncbi:MAG: hypothetical protein NXH75_05800 [Halobacteriovoraceae bacterium]|jgi:hypothetical protein|nr:hypothetical protein [Halobacteriovoraceae bacterium]
MDQESRTQLQKQIETLESSLTGNMMTDMDIRDKIHNIKMKLNGVKPVDSHYDCVGCGS